MRHPLLPCPKCMTSLEEEGFIYPGGRVVARETATRMKGLPLGVQYVCTRCGSTHTIALHSRRVAAG